MKKIVLLLVAMMLFTATAAAETSFTGTVVSAGSVSVLVPADGILSAVGVQSGDRVAAGDSIAQLLDTTVYAAEAGTVRLFGSEGASLDEINERYGAVLYLLPDAVYTLSASTQNAYSAEENRRIVPGETVHIRSSANLSRTGTGIVTGVSGSDYLVDIQMGEFDDEETVFLYRSDSFNYTTRIGKGTVTYTGTIGYTGTGEEASIGTASSTSSRNSSTTEETTTDTMDTPKSLVRLLVEDGQHVTPGTPLFTVSTAEAYEQTMTAPESGIVATVHQTAGTTVTQGTAVAELYPDRTMRLALSVSEMDLDQISLGDTVTIQFLSGETLQGTVEVIQGHAQEQDEEEEDETYFTVYVAFTPTNAIAYGMTATVTIAE